MYQRVNALPVDISTIRGLSADSRLVEDGFLFAALPGVKSDGRDFIGDALARGASVILAPRGTVYEGAHIVTDENPRRAFALIAAAFYGAQPAHVVAVGGTNGKSSTVNFIRQIWSALGYRAASLGTLGVHTQDGLIDGAMTTPDPVSLHKILSGLARDGITHLSLESSSHGLDQYRLDGTDIQVAGFTSFSRDHMDYHGDMQSYLMAKARLFSEVLACGGTAVLNADIPEFEMLLAHARGSGHRVMSYGFEGTDCRIKSLTPHGCGQDMEVHVLGRDYTLSLPLVGAFQAMNVLCAAMCVIAQEAENEARIQDIMTFLPSIEGTRGRMEHVSGSAVYVDYAHTPDALDQALKSLRPHTTGRLLCVFGCGGERDTGKRYVMGQVAAAQADVVIVTDDNPRSENPENIRAAILRGAHEVYGGAVHDLPGRRDAILFALSLMKEGDVLLVAGKGHEQGQIFNGYSEPFDDVEEVKKSIRKLGESRHDQG